MLTPEQAKQAAQEFKALIKQQCGVEISDEEAIEQASDFLQMCAVMFGYSE